MDPGMKSLLAVLLALHLFVGIGFSRKRGRNATPGMRVLLTLTPMAFTIATGAIGAVVFGAIGYANQLGGHAWKNAEYAARIGALLGVLGGMTGFAGFLRRISQERSGPGESRRASDQRTAGHREGKSSSPATSRSE